MRTFLLYLLTTALGLSILGVALRLWEADFHVPFYYTVGGDIHLSLAMIKGITETGGYLTNPSLGAPGVMDLRDFPSPDTNMFLLFKLLSLLTSDPFLIWNLFYFLTFGLAIVTSLFVFLRFGIAAPIASAASLLYAFAPYHFCAIGHPTLAAYFPLPLAVMVCLWLLGGEPILFDRNEAGRVRPILRGGRAWLAVLSCLLLSLAGPYYAFFGTFFLLASGLLAWLRRPALTRLLDTGLLVGLVMASFAAQLAPYAIHAIRQGANPVASKRSVSYYYIYALTIKDLLSPTIGHRLPPVRSMALEERDRKHVDLTRLHNDYNEARTCAPLGAIGSVGFLVLIVVTLAGSGVASRRLPILLDLATLNVAALLLALNGGFGELIAHYVTAKIRCYNRMSIFIELFALFALALLLQRAWAVRARTPGRRARFVALLVAGVALGLLDQIPAVIVPDYARDAASFRSDRRFVERIEASLPPGSQVFQLPPNSFPEFGSHFEMYDYNHFRGYFHSKTLRWSYGVLRGRPEEKWQSELAPLPIPALVDRLIEAGFAGIYVNRMGHASRGQAVVRELAERLGEEPLVSDDRQLVFFRLPAKGRASRGGVERLAWRPP